MADKDIGYIFLNFMMSKEVRPFCGMDFSNVMTEEYWGRGYLGGW